MVKQNDGIAIILITILLLLTISGLLLCFLTREARENVGDDSETANTEDMVNQGVEDDAGPEIRPSPQPQPQPQPQPAAPSPAQSAAQPQAHPQATTAEDVPDEG